MSFLDFAIIFFLLLVVLIIGHSVPVLYPPFIFCAMWLLDLTVTRLGFIEVNPVHSNTLVIVARAGSTFIQHRRLVLGLAPRELLRIHPFSPKPKRFPDSPPERPYDYPAMRPSSLVLRYIAAQQIRRRRY